MTETHTCPTCGESDVDPLPVEDGFDPGERLCVRCGLALWVPTPAQPLLAGTG